MPRKTLTLDQKLRNAKKRLRRILSKYDNNRDYIIIKGRDYLRSKDTNLKTSHNDYQSLLRAEKVIHQINQVLDESSSSDECDNDNDNDHISNTHRHGHGHSRRNNRSQNVASDNNDQIPLQQVQEDILKCDNCHRISNDCNNDFHSIHFIQRSSDSIVRRRKFKHIIYKATNPIIYNLCMECNSYLSPDHNSNVKDDEFVWCSYIWALLSNRDIHEKYGDRIWRFIPTEWRPWWMTSLSLQFPTIFSEITMEKPSPAFKDKTIDINEWDEDINSYYLARLASSSNKFLCPTVKCPWGCSEFQHKVGYLPLDIIFQRILQRCSLKMYTKSDLNYEKKVVSIREDYIRDDGDDDSWIFNPNWKILPSITFVKGKGPSVLTCKEHDGGTKRFMVHPCRWQHNLPSRRPDQLCQAVVQPRILKPVKASKYSTSFQMFHQTGTFNGIDTCSATSYGNFDFISKLSAESEARSIANRPDINAHLTKLRKENVISQFVESGRRKFAATFSRSVDYQHYTKGGTYVSLEASIILQNENSNRNIKAWLDHRDSQPVRFNFVKYWSDSIYPCQTMTPHGVTFPKVPILKSNDTDTCLLWTVATLLSRVENLWKIVTHVELRTSKWHGWMLAYLTKHCFNEGDRRQSRNDPFKLKYMQTIHQLQKNVQHEKLSDYFSDLNGVFFCELIDGDGDQLNLQQVISASEETIMHSKIIIVNQFNPEKHESGVLEESILIQGFTFELRTVIGSRTLANDKWDGVAISRHGGVSFSKWWLDERLQNQPIQIEAFPWHNLPYNDNYTLVYVLVEDIDIDTMRNQFLTNIGGQVHVQCAQHCLPLIISMDRANTCSCGRKDHYRCCEFNCDVFLCRRCFEGMSCNTTSFIPSPTTREDVDVDSDRSSTDDDDSSGELVELHDDEEDLDTYMAQNIDENDDNFEDFLMSSYDPDIDLDGSHDIGNENMQGETNNDISNLVNGIPTTNAGEFASPIEEETQYGGTFGNIKISGHVLLNQCGTLLTRKKHQIKGSSRHHFFLQKIIATCDGSSIPLMYPEGILFPSIHWKMAPDNCSIVGCIPAPLLIESVGGSRFASIQSHVRSRLTNPSCSTSSDSRYCSHCYDMLTNMSANHEDTRMILNRGLTIGEDKTGGLGLRGKGDSALLESVDNKEMVRNLCFSQKYTPWDHFLTHTCNMKTHFGTSPIKNWIDGIEWKRHFPNFYDLELDEQKEIEHAVLESSAGLLLRIWEEVFLLFIDYLRKSPSSPFKKLNAIFARKEYQSNRGNLSHSHMMIQLNWDAMNEEERIFVNNLIRASVFDIVKPKEVEKFIDEGIFDNQYDIFTVYENAELFLPHRCNDACLVRNPDGSYRCRKIDNVKASADNTKHQFIPLPNDYSIPCLKILESIGLTDVLVIDDDGNVKEFKSSLPFFHPVRHVPPTNPTNDINISPIEGYIFAITRAMQNVQRLTGTGGCSKYVCKYIAKIDEQNYIVILVNGEGQLVTQAIFLHNTKITSSKMGEDKVRQKDDKKPQGRCISHMEMLHVMLKYPEVVTNLEFIKVTTMPLELRAGIAIESDIQNEDGAFVGSAIDGFRKSLDLDDWRLHTPNQLLILDDLKLSKVSVDKVTQFSLRPPELRSLFNKLGNYYRWFVVSKTKVKVQAFPDKITLLLPESSWIDGLQRQVRVRKKALSEINSWFEKTSQEEYDDHMLLMVELFKRVHATVQSVDNDDRTTAEDSTEEHQDFCRHVFTNLLHDDDNKDHLPIPVFSYITPTMTTSFVLHIMLSMGCFDTEIDLCMHQSLRECLRYCKLIGTDDDEVSLLEYTKVLTCRYIEEQVQYFPNTQRVIDYWIITAFRLFRRIIVDNDLPVTEMPPVQLSSLLASNEEEIVNYRATIKSNLIDAAFKEIGDDSMTLCEVPTKVELIGASPTYPLEWNPVASFSKSPLQSVASFEEQKLAVETCVDAIDSYRNLMDQNSYTKNVGIRGSPGGGKTWCMMYILLYAISQGNTVITTAMMCKRALQLGGIHIHQTFMIPIDNKTSAHRQAELAILVLLRKPKKMDFLRAINILFFDEMGQVSDVVLAILDIILRKVRNSNIYMGGVLIIFSMDHTQIQPIGGRPFLTSCHIIPCFKMVALEHSVRASNDDAFVRIQKIARFNYSRFETEPELIDEFVLLCSNSFTFVESWDNDAILPSTMRLYSKKVPAREASRQFVARVRRQVDDSVRIEKVAEDVEKSRYSHQDWRIASESTSSQLEQMVREPKTLLFFKGAIFDITFNVEGQFSNTQIAILFDLPTEEELSNWRKVKLLKTPLGLKEIIFDPQMPKEEYLQRGYVEIEVGMAPERTQYLTGNNQGKRKQYGLKHHVTSTIHAAMGDTLPSMATEISLCNSNFNMWDKGQMIVILSRTKYAKDTIFVGGKNDTLAALKNLLTRKTQWTDYMEEVLQLITVGVNPHVLPVRRVMTQATFPYRICDVSLPQCNTGYVYMLMSVNDHNYSYIGKTLSIRRRIQQHNSGVGSVSTEPLHLRPYALFAYICGFDSRNDLLFYIERVWKEKRDRLIRNGVNDLKAWAYCGFEIISELNEENFGVKPSDLTLVCLFKE